MLTYTLYFINICNMFTNKNDLINIFTGSQKQLLTFLFSTKAYHQKDGNILSQHFQLGLKMKCREPCRKRKKNTQWSYLFLVAFSSKLGKYSK